MNDKEATKLLELSRHEIEHLRAIIRELGPKAEAWDRMGVVIGMIPQRGQSMAEDLVWRIDRHLIDRHREDQAADNEPATETEGV